VQPDIREKLLVAHVLRTPFCLASDLGGSFGVPVRYSATLLRRST